MCIASPLKKHYFLHPFCPSIPQKCLATLGSCGECINRNCRWLHKKQRLQYSCFLTYRRVRWQSCGHVPGGFMGWFGEILMKEQGNSENNYLATLILSLTLPTILSPFTEQWTWWSNHVYKQRICQDQFLLNKAREVVGYWVVICSLLQKAAIRGFYAASAEADMISLKYETHFGTWFSIFMTLWQQVIK